MSNRLTEYGVCMSLLVALSGCSSQSTAPQKGTPAFYWGAAHETYAAGDYVKTMEHLGKVVATDNEHRDKALPWLLVMTSGMARGYTDLADSYEAGGRVRKTDPALFRKNMSSYRGMAARHSLQFAEAFALFQKAAKDPVILDFKYPVGSPGQPTALTRVTMGQVLQGGEPQTAERAALQRGVLLATCEAVGAANDAAKTQEMFKGGAVTVPKNVFVAAAARSLYEQSNLYSRRKMDEPEKLRIFCERANEVLKELPDSKEKKDLVSKIQARLKENKVS